MTIIATRKSQQNEAWLDPWSFVHAAIGLAAGLVGMRFIPAILLATLYDAAEQVAERKDWGQKIFKTSGPESIGNVAADLLVFAGGWWLGNLWNNSDGSAKKNPSLPAARRRAKTSRPKTSTRSSQRPRSSSRRSNAPTSTYEVPVVQ